MCHGTGVERFYHGTKADLNTGDLIKPGHTANYGKLHRTTTYVYLTGTLDAATWGAELALGEGRGRIYPTVSMMSETTLPLNSVYNSDRERCPCPTKRSFSPVAMASRRPM
jgi:Rifampin ADP-ribosyl transferase